MDKSLEDAADLSPPGGSTSDDITDVAMNDADVTPDVSPVKDDVTEVDPDINQLSHEKDKMSDQSTSLEENQSEPSDKTSDNNQSESSTQIDISSSVEEPNDCLVNKTQESAKDTSKSDDFVIVIEPKKTSSGESSPTMGTTSDLETTPTEVTSEGHEVKPKQGAPETPRKYSLRTRENRINWSHALGETSDTSTTEMDWDETEVEDESAKTMPKGSPLVIEPVAGYTSPSLVQQLHSKPENLKWVSDPEDLSLRRISKGASRMIPPSRDVRRSDVRRSDVIGVRRSGDDVIVSEDTAEVVLVRDGEILLPESDVTKSGTKVLGNLRSLLRHFVKVAPRGGLTTGLYACPRCRMGFSQRADWLKHRQQCLGEESENSLLYYCNRCPSSFARHRDWVSHRKSHTVVTPKWMCDRCYRKFTSRRDLRDHRVCCKGVPGPSSKKPMFQCKICDKSFPYPSALKVHSETHVLKHKCPICDLPFTRFYEMTKHVRAEHPDVETHPCEHCGKVFDRLTMLYRHKSDGDCPSTSLHRQ